MYTAYNAFIKNHLGPSRSRRLLQLLASFLFGVSVTIAVIKLLFLLNNVDLNPKQYVYVDVEKVIEVVNESLAKQTTKQSQAGQLNEAEISVKLNAAKEQFNHLLQTYVEEHNAVIFSSSKVIAGAENITEYFAQEILRGDQMSKKIGLSAVVILITLTAFAVLMGSLIMGKLDTRPFKFEDFKSAEALKTFLELKYPIGIDANIALKDLSTAGASCHVVDDVSAIPAEPCKPGKSQSSENDFRAVRDEKLPISAVSEDNSAGIAVMKITKL